MPVSKEEQQLILQRREYRKKVIEAENLVRRYERQRTPMYADEFSRWLRGLKFLREKVTAAIAERDQAEATLNDFRRKQPK